MKAALFKLSDKLHYELKLRAVQEKTSMSEIAIRLFQQYLQIPLQNETDPK